MDIDRTLKIFTT